MLIYREVMEKLAAAKKKYNTNDVDKERELIRQYQMTHNPIIFQQILLQFKGAISAAIRQSGNQDIGDPAAVHGRAIAAVKDAVESYDPTRNRKPSAHITDGIKWALKKAGYRSQNETRMGEAETIDSGYINIAENSLRRQRIPITPISLQKEIQEMNSGKKGKKKAITTSQIERVKSMERMNLSGGGIVQGEGEKIRLEDIKNTGGGNAGQLQDDEYNKEIVMARLSRLSPVEQGVIRDKEGLGTNKPESSWNHIALNNNLKNSYTARTIYNKAIQKLKDMGDRGE